MESDWQLLCPTIQAANLHLLQSKIFTDVTFVVGDEKEEIEAHKLILMSRSPVFEAMFERWETDKNSKIEVPEVSARSFQMFLKILYANEFDVTGVEAAEVLYLADKYNIPDMATKCSDLLKSTIDVKSAIHIFQIATKLEQDGLQTQALEFILENAKLVFEETAFLKIDVDALRTILENDRLKLEEITVFRAVMRWAEHICNVQKMECTIETKRIVLKDIIHLIRFPLMSSREFTDEVIGKYHGILTDSETVPIYMHYNSGLQLESKHPMLPFSTIKRWTGPVLTVDPFKVTKDFHDSNCWQYGQPGYQDICETSFGFISSGNIRLTGIELYDQSYKGSLFSHCFSISVYPDNQPTSRMTLTKPQPKSPNVFDVRNGIDVTKGVIYVVNIKLDVGEIPLGRSRARVELFSSIQVHSKKESVHFTFSQGLSKCVLRKNRHNLLVSGQSNCVCEGQIKAIHFML